MSELIEKWRAEVEHEEKLSIAKAVAIDQIKRMKPYKIGKSRIPTVKVDDVIEVIERIS